MRNLGAKDGMPSVKSTIILALSGLMIGGTMYGLWGCLQPLARWLLPPVVFCVAGWIAKIGLFVSMAKGGLGLAGAYNRPRVYLFKISLVAMLVNMLDHPSAGNIVLRTAQLMFALHGVYILREPHEPYCRCRKKWAFGIFSMIIAATFGVVMMEEVLPEPVCEAGVHWVLISITGGLVMYTAVVITLRKFVPNDSITFLALYGLGNAVMVVSYCGTGQHSGPGVFLNSALAALLVWKLITKFLYKRGKKLFKHLSERRKKRVAVKKFTAARKKQAQRRKKEGRKRKSGYCRTVA